MISSQINLKNGQPDSNAINGLAPYISGLGLFSTLWNDGSSSINVIEDPNTPFATNQNVGGGGAIIKYGTSLLPGGSVGNTTFAQLAELIGHELAHAEVPDLEDIWTSAANPTAAALVGERDEAGAYVAQYVIASQVGDSTFAPMQGLDHGTLLRTLNSDAVGTVVPLILTINSLTTSTLYTSAVGTYDSSGDLLTNGNLLNIVSTLPSSYSSDTNFTNLEKWQDQWVFSNVYQKTAINTLPFTITNLALKHNMVQVQSTTTMLGTVWTFTGNKVPVVLGAVSTPDNKNLSGMTATLTFAGEEDGSSIKAGTFVYSVSSASESLLYGGWGSTLTANSGADWFYVNSSYNQLNGVVTINPHVSLLLGTLSSAGGIFIDGTQLGGTSGARLKPVSSDGATEIWSIDGTTSGIQYTLKNQTLTITGVGTNDSVVVNDFGAAALKAAEGASGCLGIYLSPDSVTVQGANSGVDPPLANFTQGSSDSFTYGVDAPYDTTQTIQVTLTGAAPTDFGVLTGNTVETIGSDGTFNLTLAAGATSTTFALLDETSDNEQSDIAPGATLQLAASTPNPAGGTPIEAGSIQFNYVPTPWNTDAQTQPSDQLTGTPVGGGPSVTGFIGDGNDDYVLATTPSNLIELQNSGNDSIVGGSGADSIYGGKGNDIIAGGGGTDIILTGNGSSEIYAGSKTNLGTAISSVATATATGAQGDFIAVGDGNNTIVAGNGNDAITAGIGNNVVVLGPGNDVFVGGWETTSVASNWLAPVTGLSVVFYNTGLQFSGYLNPFAQPYNGAIEESFPLGGTVEQALEGPGSDTVIGGTGNDLIALANGNNYVEAGSGTTTVLGGMGSDTIIGGTGTDYLKGGGGATYIYGGSGADSLYGGDGNDTIIGGSGNSTILSGAYYNIASDTYQTDFQNANLDQNYVTGGTGNDVIYGSAGQDTLLAGSGNTTIYGGSGLENIAGGSGEDYLFGGTGNGTITAGSGNDTIQVDATSSSTSIVYGGIGTDSINGGSGTNILYAGDGGTASGVTSVYALQSDSSAQTTIYGGDGTNYLRGRRFHCDLWRRRGNRIRARIDHRLRRRSRHILRWQWHKNRRWCGNECTVCRKRGYIGCTDDGRRGCRGFDALRRKRQQRVARHYHRQRPHSVTDRKRHTDRDWGRHSGRRNRAGCP